MEIGKIIIAKTHADFLNKLLNKEFKGYYKNTYPYLNLDIWFIRLNGEESKSGWTNTLEKESEITEEYTGNPKKRLKGAKMFPTKKRAIFDIIDSIVIRQYKFLGVFEVEGDNDKRVWKKIYDNLDFPIKN